MNYLLFSLFVITFYFLVRNRQVFVLRSAILDRISRLCERDITEGHEFRWRYDKFQTVSYEKMVYQFWKSVTAEAFYDDLSFLENPYE